MGWLCERFGQFSVRFLGAALFLGALSAPALAANVNFTGTVGWSGDRATFVILTVDGIRNYDATGTSGKLRVEFWGGLQPFAGSFASQYQMATYEVGPLAAGAQTPRIVEVVPFTPPPSGDYYFAMVLTEYTGAPSNDGYTLRRYLNFPDLTHIYGPADTTPPTVSITSPASGNVSGTVTIAANASDNVGVTRVDFYVNGTLVGTDNSAPYQYAWNTTTLPNGAATLYAKAFDAKSNVKQSSSVAVNVANIGPPPDLTPPTVSIASPTGGNVAGTITVSANASDNIGVTRVDFYVNGVLVGTDATAPYQYTWNTTTLPNGAATLYAKAFDANSNAAQSSGVSVTVANVVAPPADKTPPTVSITSPTGGGVVGTITVSASASDNVGVNRVELYVNGTLVGIDASAPYQFSWKTTSIANGPAQLKTVAYDAAGNLAQSPTVSVWVFNPVAAPPDPLATGYAIEYYNAPLDHYFVSASASDIAALDSGQFMGWARTGNAFKVYTDPASNANPVCRFYIPPAVGDSHFYTASPAECADAVVRFPMFMLESESVFYVNLPDAVSGACPANMVPVYRVWNGRPDSNHRYMTDPSLRDQMTAKGYVAEGYGPDAVIMCAPM